METAFTYPKRLCVFQPYTIVWDRLAVS